MQSSAHDRICLMVPTYGRAETLLPRFIESALRQAAEPERLRFSFCVDDDDPTTRRYLERVAPLPAASFEILSQRTSAPHLASFYNQLFECSRFDDAGTLVSMVGDDMIFRTPGYEERILETVNAANGRAIVHCNDGVLGARLCTNLFVPRQLVEATDAPFMCPEFAADMIDVVWNVVAHLTGLRRYLADVLIEHDHSTKHPVESRDRTWERLAPLQRQYQNPASHVRANACGAVLAQRLIDRGLAEAPGHATVATPS